MVEFKYSIIIKLCVAIALAKNKFKGFYLYICWCLSCSLKRLNLISQVLLCAAVVDHDIR